MSTCVTDRTDRLVEALACASELTGSRWEDHTIIFAAETLLRRTNDVDALVAACQSAAIHARGRLSIADIVDHLPSTHTYPELSSYPPLSKAEARRNWRNLVAALDEHARAHHGAESWEKWLSRPIDAAKKIEGRIA